MPLFIWSMDSCMTIAHGDRPDICLSENEEVGDVKLLKHSYV